MKTLPRPLIIITLVVLWIFVVVLPYYLFHRPFELQVGLGIANTLGDVGVVALLLALAAALGHRVLRAFQFLSPLEAIVIQCGVGYGIIAFTVYVFGFVGLLQPPVFWVLVGGALLLLYRDVRGVWARVRAIELPLQGRGEKFIAIFLALSLAMGLIFALTPPTGWDGIQYHLVYPKLALEAGRFNVPPDNLSLNNPSLVELLFLVAMGLKSDSAAQVIHWSYLVLVVGAVVVFAERYFTRRIGWLAAALLVAVPSVLLVSTWAYNDAALMLYTLTALYWTLRALETQRTRDFVLAGMLAGLTLGEKYTASFVPLTLGAIVLFQGGLRLPGARAWRNAILLGGVALALGLPWYVRNIIFVQNPVYPFVFGGLYWDAWRTAWYSRFGSGLMNEPLQLLVVPWLATVRGVQAGEFDATIGALLLAFLPFNLLKPTEATKNAPTRAMWFLVAVLFAFWVLGVAQSKLLWQTRLLFPAFPLLALLAAEGWNRLSQVHTATFSAQRFGSMVIAVALGLNLLSNVVATIGGRPLEVLVGIETRRDYLARNLGAHYAMTEWVNANLPAEARIVTLWEPRSYYIDRFTDADAIVDRFAHLTFLHGGDADAIAEEWRRAGFTHVLLYRAGMNDMLQTGYDPIGASEVETFRTLEAKHLRLMYDQTPLDAVSDGETFALENWQEQPYAIYELR